MQWALIIRGAVRFFRTVELSLSDNPLMSSMRGRERITVHLVSDPSTSLVIYWGTSIISWNMVGVRQKIACVVPSTVTCRSVALG